MELKFFKWGTFVPYTLVVLSCPTNLTGLHSTDSTFVPCSSKCTYIFLTIQMARGMEVKAVELGDRGNGGKGRSLGDSQVEGRIQWEKIQIYRKKAAKGDWGQESANPEENYWEKIICIQGFSTLLLYSTRKKGIFQFLNILYILLGVICVHIMYFIYKYLALQV